MTFTSVSDVSEQIRTGLRHSCRSLPPLGWANNNIWCWYNGESRHTRPLLKAILLHVQSATVPPGHTWHTASVNRPVCTEEDITASPRTETPARQPPGWRAARVKDVPLEPGDWPIHGCCRTDNEILKIWKCGFTSCLHHKLSPRD